MPTVAKRTLALLTRLLALPDVHSPPEMLRPGEEQSPVLPIHFRRGETSLRLFTTIATLGTPRDRGGVPILGGVWLRTRLKSLRRQSSTAVDRFRNRQGPLALAAGTALDAP